MVGRLYGFALLLHLIQVVGSIDEIPSRYTAAVRIMKHRMVSKLPKEVNTFSKF